MNGNRLQQLLNTRDGLERQCENCRWNDPDLKREYEDVERQIETELTGKKVDNGSINSNNTVF
jgi:hypothetical protein